MPPLRVLLVNPWIHDFAAYDFWARPLGLLLLGAVLRECGCDIRLLDCLDRNHPRVVREVGRIRPKSNGTGKFYREPIEKPEVLRQIPRTFSRYGMPRRIVTAELSELDEPDVILVTSSMTYWYTGVAETVHLLREHFLGVPIILGGTYATLLPDHAITTLGPDLLVEGPAEGTIVRTVNEICAANLAEKKYDDLDSMPYPAYDLYASLESVSIMTSRGCPFQCSFCASRLLSGTYQRRDAGAVVDEIEYWVHRHGIKNVAFYDDALFIDKEQHIHNILVEVLKRGITVAFHTPNGVFPKEIDESLASLMYESGFRTIRLSYETSNRDRQREMASKVSDENLAGAVEALVGAGYTRDQLGVYVLMGLPGQPLEEIVDSIAFVLSLGVKVRTASFSPIPGTREWRRAVDEYGLEEEIDPLLTNNTIFPLRGDVPLATFELVRGVTREYNAAVREGALTRSRAQFAEEIWGKLDV